MRSFSCIFLLPPKKSQGKRKEKSPHSVLLKFRVLLSWTFLTRRRRRRICADVCQKKKNVEFSIARPPQKSVFKVVGVSFPPSRTASSPLFPHPPKEGGFFAGREMRKSLFTFPFLRPSFPHFFLFSACIFPLGKSRVGAEW